jgi:hypothetical protein
MKLGCDAGIAAGGIDGDTIDATEDTPLERGSMTGYTPHQSTYLAYRIMLEGRGEDAFAKSLSSARVETKPHQVDASLFALYSPLSRGGKRKAVIFRVRPHPELPCQPAGTERLCRAGSSDERFQQ